MSNEKNDTMAQDVSPEQFNQAAIDRYLQYLKFFPNSAETHYNLGIAYAEMGQFDEAEASFKNTIIANPEFMQAYINLGGIFFAQEDWDACMHYNKEALRVDEKNVIALANVGLMHLMRGEIQKSIDTCLQVVEKVPEFPQAHYCLAVGYLETEDREKAKEHYKKAMDMGFEPIPAFKEKMEGLLDS